MLVYSETKAGFRDDILANRIEDRVLANYQRKLGHSTGRGEFLSWKNSLIYMNNILMDSQIPDNTKVHIEYKIPQTSKRIDFIITGKDKSGNDSAIIVELKQWSDVKSTSKDGIVSTFINNSLREVEHPSYQAWTYAALLQDFNETVRDENIGLYPCAYLHNCCSKEEINSSFYKEHTDKAPSFIRSDSKRLSDFVKQYVKYGDSDEIMYRIDNGKISPSKNLADKLESMLNGNEEFIMIDDQKMVFENVLELSRKITGDQKHILIVEGGPGTGKSVIAINLLVELTKQGKIVQYVTKNAAPRHVYESKLTDSFKKSHITNLFKGSGSYTECEINTFDILIVDEAHRLNEKSGMFQNMGENQVKELINAANLTVFLLDEDQQVTFKDIGEKQEILNWVDYFKIEHTEMKLSSQFRCNGSNGYLAWLDNILQIRETANEDINELDYDFQIVDNPNKLKNMIFEKNSINNKARLVAGYCWNWITKKNEKSTEFDITIPEHNFAMKWNLSSDGNLWILKPEAVSEIGCIHTCQGLELDYIGVIVGTDLIVRNGEIQILPENRAQTDQSLKGYKTLLKKEPELTRKRAEKIIKNTYRTLMTRGQKGCYVYFCDKETEEYFKECIAISNQKNLFEKKSEAYDVLDDVEDSLKFEEYLPFYTLEVACGKFTDGTPEECIGWINVAEQKLDKDMFVIRAKGKSMEPRIPDGSYCIFKANPKGSRENKIVLARSNKGVDPELGEFTIKKYHSEKEFFDDGTWRHKKIILIPENCEFDQIELENIEAGDFRIAGEFIGII